MKMTYDLFFDLAQEIVDNAVAIEDNGNKYTDEKGNVFVKLGAIGGRSELLYNGHLFFAYSIRDDFCRWSMNHYVYDCEKGKEVYKEYGWLVRTIEYDD